MPENFSNDGTSLLPETIVHKEIAFLDEFTRGCRITIAGCTSEETAEQYIFDRAFKDLSTEVHITKQKNNFTVLTEAFQNGNITLGSGVCVEAER